MKECLIAVNSIPKTNHHLVEIPCQVVDRIPSAITFS